MTLMTPDKMNLTEKFAAFSDHWSPKIVAELNGQHVKLSKFKGEFVWHSHDNEDEMFLVWRGEMTIDQRYGPAHSVALTSDGLLAQLAGSCEIMVNSLHGQGIDRPAPGLRVEAIAPHRGTSLEARKLYTVIESSLLDPAAPPS